MAYARPSAITSPEETSPYGARWRRWLVAAGVLLVALNLRAAVTSVSAVLGEVRDGLGLSGALTGLLTTLPVVCFAVFGMAAPALARRLGAHRLVLAAVAALVTGLALRALAHTAVLFLVLSGVALAGIAVGNVLLPALVKRHFPRHLGPMTALYSAGMAAGSTLGAGITVPVGQALGGWREGLLVWAGLAAVALLPWLSALGMRDARWNGRTAPRAGHATAGATTPAEAAGEAAGAVASAGVGYGGRALGVQRASLRLARSPLAWALAVYFGAQSMQAYAVFGWLAQVYRDAGFPAETAGALLALVTALGIPAALVTSPLAARGRDQRPHVVALAACYLLGYAGLALVPRTLPWLWAVFIGVSVGGTFPLALTMVTLRSRASAGTAALSGFTQGVGYIISALGPLLVGVLHDATGGWHVPLALLGLLVVPQLVSGLAAGRSRYVEDDLDRLDLA